MKLYDLHSDFPTALMDFNKFSFDKNTTVIGAVYSGSLSFEKAISIATKVKGKNVKLAFEDIGYNDVDIDKIISLKPVYVSLTYNGENQFGYGCDFDLPLKNLGKSAVKYLANSNVVIDVAHLSEKGGYSVLDVTDKVICSHTALKQVYNHKRNLSNALIKEILSVGGIIGLTPVGYFLNEKGASLYDFYRHIDTFVNNFGVNSLAIGSDFYGTDYVVGGIKSYFGFIKLKNLLLEKGYSTESVDKIFYQNAEKHFKN